MTTYDLAREQASAPSAQTLNAFMDQKNKVLQLINVKEFVEAKTLLDILHPLWNTLGFGYKGRELYKFLRETIRTEIQEEEEFLAGERKNSKVRAVTQHWINTLTELAKGC